MCRWTSKVKRLWLGLIACCVVFFALTSSGRADDQPPIVVHGSRGYARLALDALCRQWAASGAGHAECVTGNPWQPFAEVVRGQGDAVAHSPFAEVQLEVNEEPAIPAEIAKPVLLGEVCVLMIVNQANPVKELGPKQISHILAPKDRPATWGEVGGRGGKVNVYVEGENSLSVDVTRWRFLAYSNGRRGGRLMIRDDAVRCSGPDEIVKKVARDVNGVGILLWKQPLRTDGVRALGISPKDGATAIIPEVQATVLQPDYPLSRPVLLYVRKDAEQRMAGFVGFCVSAEGARCLEKTGIITMYSQAKGIGDRRIVEAKRK